MTSIKNKFVSDLKNRQELDFIKIYDGFRFEKITYPTDSPVMAISTGNISSYCEMTDTVTAELCIIIKIYSAEKSCNMHISEIINKVCSVLLDMNYSFKYNGYKHNSLGFFESEIYVNLPPVFIIKGDD